MRARLALAVSSITYELREVVLKDKPAELLAASPKGTVPVLVLNGGQVIDESLQIMLWALEQNDPERWLAPARDTASAVQHLLAVNDGVFKHSLDRYKYPHRYPLESIGDLQGFAHTHRALGAHALWTLENQLTEGCLFGPSHSLADMAILPFVRQFAHTDAAWFAAQHWPRLQGWLTRFEASNIYNDVMRKTPVWQAPP
jgi:glutathione S-transferase